MNRFMKSMVKLSEDVYESRKDFINIMFLSGIDKPELETTATKSTKTAPTYTLHHCSVCNAEHY